MSHFLDRLTFFTRKTTLFPGSRRVTSEDRTWETVTQALAARQDRALHPRRNCTGSCSWKIYVKAAS